MNNHELRIMDHTGDTVVTWNPVSEVETMLAEARFNQAKATGHAAFAVTPNTGDGEMIKSFDPSLELIVMRSQIVGG